jgi:SIR2-like domain
VTGAVPTAAEITVRETLALLDGVHNAVAEGVCNDRYVFWLGSGISRNLPGLEAIIARVLTYLQERRDHADDDCAFGKALDEAIELAELNSAELESIDKSQPVARWPALPRLCTTLANRYSKLLDIGVGEEPTDYLLWNAVDLAVSYPADAEPGCEHICLAILSMEGVLSDAASANWDGLIEHASKQLSGRETPPMRVLVDAEDFRAGKRQTDLLKFHGCAILAVNNPTRYRAAITAAARQITDWPNDPERETMRGVLKNLVATKRTLMMGLSAQDSNIKDLFSKAKQQMNWLWSTEPPAQVFADDQIGQEQRALLKVIYDENYQTHRAEIDQAALIRAYAAQTLTALVLYVVAKKLGAYLEQADVPHLQPTEISELKQGLEKLRDIAAGHAEPDPLQFVRNLASIQSRALETFREGAAPVDALRYVPVSQLHVGETANDPGLATNGLPQLAATLSLLGMGTEENGWLPVVASPASAPLSALRTVGSSSADIYFAANNQVAVKLEGDAMSASTGGAVMIHSTGPVPPRKRSARATYGRRGSAGIRHVDMSHLLESSTDLSELKLRFREASAL